MRKFIGLSLLGVAAVAVAAPGVSPLFQGFVSALQNAKTLSASYDVKEPSGAGNSFEVRFQKPNLARIETPTQILVADGKQITTYDRAEKTYFLKPQTEGELASALTGDELNIWASFFGRLPQPASTKDLGTKIQKGVPFDTVSATFGAAGKKTVTYFLDKQDKVVRKAQIDLSTPDGTSTNILLTRQIAVNGSLPADTFTFKAPADAREVSLAEMNSAKWFTDLGEAKAAAAASGKSIFVDFMATWCGPCKLLERNVFTTDKFKALGKKMVFLRIDVDAQENVAAAYKIEAMPTQMLLDKDGAILSTTVGYGGPEAFFAWIGSALSGK